MKSMNIDKVFDQLGKIDLASGDYYSLIKKIFEDETSMILFPSIIISKGSKFYRSRCHDYNTVILKVKELSYRTDIENIIHYGRANRPYQTIFYCGNVRPTAILETGKIFRGNNFKYVDNETITTSVWEAQKDIKLTLFLSSNIAKDKNDLIKSYDLDVDRIINDSFPNDFEKIKHLISRISDEFVKDVKGQHFLYQTSCLFANYAYDFADGIIYPSFQRSFNGLNVAIKPSAVDNKMKFVSALKETFIKTSFKRFQQYSQQEAISYSNGLLSWGEEAVFS